MKWIRFPKDPSANLKEAIKKPLAYAITGLKESGKSALAETIGFKYGRVIDIYGSRDNESLAWLRSPLGERALLLKGNSTEVSCNCAHVANARDFNLDMIDQYDAIISAPLFYGSLEEEWHSLSVMFEKLWKRTSWDRPVCLIIREAANLLYSRLGLGENQHIAKNYIIYVLREMRHCGYAVALDTLRWHSIDIDLRSVADYTFIKACGTDGLPDSLHFVYGIYRPFSIARLKSNKFIVISNRAPVGHGSFDLPYWHKTENENMAALFDIRVSYKEMIDYGDKGTAHVGDFEHVRIIKVRVEGIEGKLDPKSGMEKISDALGRSSKTVFAHINHHNSMIQKIGVCDKCDRVKSSYAKTSVD